VNKIPFYRRIVFKALLLLSIVLLLTFTASFMITNRLTDRSMEQHLRHELKTAQHATENFLDLIGRTSQVWAQEILYDHFFYRMLQERDIVNSNDILAIHKAKISADAIILLDKNGIVRYQQGSMHNIGDSMKHYDIVKETLSTKKSATRTVSEYENSILYSSAYVEDEHKVLGIMLVGYFINDHFLQHIRNNTDLEIALVDNSTIMSSTGWGSDGGLLTLPVAPEKYRQLLTSKEELVEITHKGKSYILLAQQLPNADASTPISVLFGYPYDWVKEQKQAIFKEQLLLFGGIFLISLLLLSSIIVKYSRILRTLSQAARRMPEGRSEERVKIDTHDELEFLAESFNNMSAELNILHRGMEQEIENKTKELKELNETLEQRVKEELEKNRQKEKQLLQQSRLAQMGEMISMIAHQWRQPLAAISSTSALIELKASRDELDADTARQKAHNISNYAQHLSTTIDDFRNFFKSQKEKKTTTYDELIASVLGIVKTSISHNKIVLIQELECHKPFSTYPNELKQVILNLIKNAEDALLENEVAAPYIKIATYMRDGGCVLEVSDNAGGIPDAIIEHIFDPYFSTKTKKDGTGLGLYMSKTIIEEHCRGTLSLRNGDEGAVFTIAVKGSE